MSTDEDFLSFLRTMAEDVKPVAAARVAAAIVVRNEIIAIGTNSRKTHPFQARFGKNSKSIFWHAETAAIRNALRCIDEDKLTHATLYVARAKKMVKRGTFVSGMACPCAGCRRAIRHYGIRKVVYTTDNESFASLK